MKVFRSEHYMLNCGHEPTPGQSPGTGVAHDQYGYSMCYECSNAAEQSAFADADVYTGYVAGDKKLFTTWPGGVLAKITALWTSRRIWTAHGSYRLRYVNAEAPDGSRWHGTGSDEYDVITLRRNKK